MGVVFFLWWLQGAAIEPWLRATGYRALLVRHRLAGGAPGHRRRRCWSAAIRRRLDPANGLILHLAVGWWAGFAILVLGLGLRMTPPRGDNWAGCLGMTLASCGIAVGPGFGEVARAALVCGFIGGIGFAAASMLKLVEVTSGYQTNWHSILEQTTGLFNGIGLAVAMAVLARSERLPVEDDATGPHARGPSRSPWASSCWGSPTSTCGRTSAQWVRVKAVPAEMAGLSRERRGSTWDTSSWH